MTNKWPGAWPKLPDDDRTQDELKAEFDAAHRAAGQALKERDFDGVASAIERERAVIEQFHARINNHRPAHSRRRISSCVIRFLRALSANALDAKGALLNAIMLRNGVVMRILWLPPANRDARQQFIAAAEP